jgi:hypothetical protein
MKETSIKRGGRPKKPVKRERQLAVICTLAERTIIVHKAKLVNLCISEYLRNLAVTGKIDIWKNALPAEVLQGIATLNHMAANVNQIAKKRNGSLGLALKFKKKTPAGRMNGTKIDLYFKEHMVFWYSIRPF